MSGRGTLPGAGADGGSIWDIAGVIADELGFTGPSILEKMKAAETENKLLGIYYGNDPVRLQRERLNNPYSRQVAMDTVGNMGGVIIGPRATPKMFNPTIARDLADHITIERDKGRVPDVEKLYKDTGGYFIAPDGYIRREIRDPSQLLTDNYNIQTSMHGSNLDQADLALNHPELFAAYPDLESYLIEAAPMNDQRYGSHNPATRQISLNSNKPEFIQDQTLVHELQHAIQKIEEDLYGMGSSPTDTRNIINDVSVRQSAINIINKGLKNGASMTDFHGYNTGNPRLDFQIDNVARTVPQHKLLDELDSLNRASKFYGTDPFDIYERELGEIEARVVGNRHGLILHNVPNYVKEGIGSSARSQIAGGMKDYKPWYRDKRTNTARRPPEGILDQYDFFYGNTNIQP